MLNLWIFILGEKINTEKEKTKEKINKTTKNNTMKKTTYQTQKSTTVVEKRESEGVIANKAKAYVKKLTDSFGPKSGFRCF